MERSQNCIYVFFIYVFTYITSFREQKICVSQDAHSTSRHLSRKIQTYGVHKKSQKPQGPLWQISKHYFTKYKTHNFLVCSPKTHFAPSTTASSWLHRPSTLRGSPRRPVVWTFPRKSWSVYSTVLMSTSPLALMNGRGSTGSTCYTSRIWEEQRIASRRNASICTRSELQ